MLFRSEIISSIEFSRAKSTSYIYICHTLMIPHYARCLMPISASRIDAQGRRHAPQPYPGRGRHHHTPLGRRSPSLGDRRRSVGPRSSRMPKNDAHPPAHAEAISRSFEADIDGSPHCHDEQSIGRADADYREDAAAKPPAKEDVYASSCRFRDGTVSRHHVPRGRTPTARLIRATALARADGELRHDRSYLA